jgi:hypothetical protein
MVPKNSWYDFFRFLSGDEDEEPLAVEEHAKKPQTSNERGNEEDALAHSNSVSTSSSSTDEKRSNPSFSQVMASIVSEKDVMESSEDEHQANGEAPVTRSPVADVSSKDLVVAASVANSN